MSKRCTCHRDISHSPDAADSVIAAFHKRFQLAIDLQFVEFQPLAVFRRLTSCFFFCFVLGGSVSSAMFRESHNRNAFMWGKKSHKDYFMST